MKDLEWSLGIYKEEWKNEKERENYDIERDLCISVGICMYVRKLFVYSVSKESHSNLAKSYKNKIKSVVIKCSGGK